jgi:hypothetical protein
MAVREGLLGPPVILRAAHGSLFAFASAAPQLLIVLGALARAGASWMEAPPSLLETPLSSSSIPAYTQSIERQNAMLPNPSIERTATGWPRYARCSFSASRGQPAAAAHVKR